MTERALTIDDLAAEFGRSPAWMRANWRDLVAAGRIPPPLLEGGHPTWSAAQLYAYLEKPLPAWARAGAAAYRAALEAAAHPENRRAYDETEKWKQELDRKMGVRA